MSDGLFYSAAAIAISTLIITVVFQVEVYIDRNWLKKCRKKTAQYNVHVANKG